MEYFFNFYNVSFYLLLILFDQIGSSESQRIEPNRKGITIRKEKGRENKEGINVKIIKKVKNNL